MTTKTATRKKSTGAPRGRPPMYGQAMTSVDVQLAPSHLAAVAAWIKRNKLGERATAQAIREMIEAVADLPGRQN